MKNMFCYIGILLAIVLIVFPPVLRAVLPDKVTETDAKSSTSILLCSNDKYIVSTNYEDDKPTLIMFKKLITEEATPIDDSLSNLYDSFSNDDEIVYTTMEDGEIAQIDLLALQHENLNTLGLLTGDINHQREYYESLNLICGIR
ncbi:MAG: hypothetical protein IJ068_06575 [Bacilli bacterium]|nr:hypothetical protein [Bacilli bacterium]